MKRQNQQEPVGFRVDHSASSSAAEHVPEELKNGAGSAAGFEFLAEALPELIWTCKPDGRCDYFNRRWVEFTGLPIEQLVGDQWRDRLHPEDREQTCGYWLAALKGDVPYDLEYRLRRFDEVYHWFKVRASPLRDQQGKITKWFGICTDIEDLKRTERNLRASDTWLKMLMDTVKDFAIISLDLENHVREWNSGAEQIFGYRPDEIIGQSGELLFLEEDRLKGVPEEELVSARRNGVAMDDRWQRRKTGERFFASGAVRPHYDERGRLKGFIKVARDVTVSKKYEEELESKVCERTHNLQELVREMEAFSYSVSHDLRAPLRAIDGYAHIALARAGNESNPAIKQLLQSIVNSTERANLLIQELLDYSRVARAELRLAPVNLDSLLHDVIASNPPLQPGMAHITIASPLPTVMAHEPTLKQSFTNLLSNAVKFVAEGTFPKVHISSENRRGLVRIWIEDNGIGIPAEDLGRIFSMFERVHSAHKYEGTGIGLALVRKAVERMGGSVGVESQLNKGSRFWLELSPAP